MDRIIGGGEAALGQEKARRETIEENKSEEGEYFYLDGHCVTVRGWETKRSIVKS